MIKLEGSKDYYITSSMEVYRKRVYANGLIKHIPILEKDGYVTVEINGNRTRRNIKTLFNETYGFTDCFMIDGKWIGLEELISRWRGEY